MPMTIENIGQFTRSGSFEKMMDQASSMERPLTPSLPGGQGASEPAAQSFGEMLAKGMEKVNDVQNQADQAVKELIAGRDKNIHETMLMMEKADMSFRLLMQVRNKVLDAYREVMRMQV